MLTQILVIEDDDAIRQGVCDAVECVGFAANGAETGEIGLELLDKGSYDLVLLDVVLPGRDGLSVLSVIRESNPTLPVIMLTARGDVNDRVKGLSLGADDYVVKPFNVRELLARVDAVLRRSPGRSEAPEQITLPDGQVADFEKREVVTKWRHTIAQGVSPGFKIDHNFSPEGPKGRHIRLDVSPTTGLKTGAASYPGLTPWANLCRHFVARSTFSIAGQRKEH
jgi:CheY-like chemotaxis protein